MLVGRLDWKVSSSDSEGIRQRVRNRAWFRLRRLIQRCWLVWFFKGVETTHLGGADLGVFYAQANAAFAMAGSAKSGGCKPGSRCEAKTCGSSADHSGLPAQRTSSYASRQGQQHGHAGKAKVVAVNTQLSGQRTEGCICSFQ